MLQSSIKNNTSLVLVESVAQKIFFIRGHKVMLDMHLAELYDIKTMVLNQAVKRNKIRFPNDFMFQLTASEKKEVITNCDNLNTLKFSSHLPYVFTEHGVAMLSSILKSPKAVEMNIQIIRAFIRIREILSSNKELAYKIEELQREQKLQNRHINTIYSLIEKLIEQPQNTNKPIGFGR
jgi:hypothetical protein